MQAVEAKVVLDGDIEINDTTREKFSSLEPFLKKNKIGFEAGLNNDKKLCVHFQSCHRTEQKCKDVACMFVNKLKEVFGCECKVEKLIASRFTRTK